MDVFPEFFLPAYGMDIKDEEGRPFGELNASASSQQGVAFELKQCKYQGSRFGKPMNVSALKQMVSSWALILSDLSEIRHLYLLRTKRTSLDMGHLWRFAQFATSIHSFLVRRKEAPFADGTLPVRLAGLFKASQGLFMTAQHMVTAGGYALESNVTTEEFLKYTEENGIFLADGRACAGPLNYIEAFVRVALHGPDEESKADDWLSRAVKDIDRFFEYATAKTNLIIAKALFRYQDWVLRKRLPEKVLIDRSYTGVSKSNVHVLVPLLGELATQGRFNILCSPNIGDEHWSQQQLSPDLRGILGSIQAVESTDYENVLHILCLYQHLEQDLLEIATVSQNRLLAAIGSSERFLLTTAEIGQAFPTSLRSQAATQ